MTPSRPYLIRAIYEWIADNGYTPYLLVDATRDDVDAPLEYAEDGRLVLNVAPRAVQELSMGNDEIAFRARFGGVPRGVQLPVNAVMAIYARENGQGMLFGDGEDAEAEGYEAIDAGGDEGDDGPPDGPDGSGGGKRPNLRVVK
ncbi:ClpXP protease specificity-enhancing factor [Halorhodospira sp. 9622]|uniref:ClpXP protease specificity-enhancing factor n=1 Tax=Halorhodospira sp. 9622 TaxID=2899136 RepID=UPI001EE8EBD0|nr:ClpXP protease specificity-enhancing factor [Halorhodospira sp. 9622]MCG5539481.1 ClpXP protease specificity-enhancing factor [Halorhodospira sp. 9622]